MIAPVHYTIVVGLDYSEASRLALHQALAIAAERAGSEVHVVHVEAAPASPSFAEALQRVHALVTDEVAAFLQARPAGADASITRVVSHVRANAPSREIAQLAADLEADLVVVGTHGRSGVARFLLGSVAHAVVNLAPCPVLVVRPKQVPLVPVIEPACPRCVAAREQSGGRELWCDQHRAHHLQRHSYYQDDRAGQETNFPLVFDER